MAKVFLSYSSQDKTIAQKIIYDLQALGIDLWSDDNLRAGDPWKQIIGDQLRQSEAVVVLVSPASLSSDWMTDEWSTALLISKRVIPVLINGATYWHLPARLREIRAFDLSAGYATDIKKLAETLREVVSLPDPKPAEVMDIDRLADEALLRAMERRGLGDTRRPDVRSNAIFVIISFEHSMDPTFEAIKAAARRVGMEAERIKDVQADFLITEAILERIDTARLIVADLTLERPNVYFELGYARGRGKTVVTLLRQGSRAHVDVRGWNYIEYIDSRPLEEDLVRRFSAVLHASDGELKDG